MENLWPSTPPTPLPFPHTQTAPMYNCAPLFCPSTTLSLPNVHTLTPSTSTTPPLIHFIFPIGPICSPSRVHHHIVLVRYNSPTYLIVTALHLNCPPVSLSFFLEGAKPLLSSPTPSPVLSSHESPELWAQLLCLSITLCYLVSAVPRSVYWLPCTLTLRPLWSLRRDLSPPLPLLHSPTPHKHQTLFSGLQRRPIQEVLGNPPLKALLSSLCC